MQKRVIHGVHHYYGTYAEMLAMTSIIVYEQFIVDTGTNAGNKYEYRGATAGWVQTHDASGAAIVSVGSAGGAGAVTTLEQFLVAGGASQTGTAVAMSSGRRSFQAVANGSSGAFTATVTIAVSNDNTNFETAGTITLSGTATTADSDGFAMDAPWAYVRASVASFTGTGATCNVYMAV